MKALLAAHARREHEGRPHPWCPGCRAESPMVEAEWVRRAHEHRLPTRITDGIPVR